MFTEESKNKINRLRTENIALPMTLREYFELLFESCCMMYTKIENEDYYTEPIRMFGILSYLLSFKHGYGFELADGWMKNEFIPTLSDSKHFLAVYDLLTMTPYIGLSSNKEDILLQFIKKAPDPGNIRVLGKPVWEIYADFLTRESKGSDAFHNAISYTMSETYKTFYKVFIS